jgi:hypothetical protein
MTQSLRSLHTQKVNLILKQKGFSSLLIALVTFSEIDKEQIDFALLIRLLGAVTNFASLFTSLAGDA